MRTTQRASTPYLKFWSPAVKVGTMLVIAAVLLVLLLINAENWPWATSGDEMEFRFSSVNGLYIGAGVHLSGVQIGKVTGIQLRPETNDVEIRARVRNGFQILRRGCGARIAMNGFVGEIYIALDNGPTDNLPLKPTDLPIIGRKPVNALELLEQASSGLEQTIALIATANQLLQTNQEAIQLGIKETREVVALTGRTIEKLSVDFEEMAKILNQLTTETDTRFQHTLLKANRLISQLETDSLMMSSQIGDITRELLRLLNMNSPKLNSILTEVQASTVLFREVSREFQRNMNTLTSDVSALVAQGSRAVEMGEANITPILENLQVTTEAFIILEENINRLLVAVQEGEGTVAQLINTPEPLEDARQTLKNVNETMSSVMTLTQRTEQELKNFELPNIGWDYELRYLSLDEHLHNELAILLSPQAKASYRFGLGVRQERIAYEFQYGYNVTDFLRARAGFMRSKVGVGIELWFLAQRLGVSVEGIGLTSNFPELNTELTFRFLRQGELLFGVENLTGKRRWTTGFRFLAGEW